MTRAARFRAYAPPAIIFTYAVILIINQALGAPASRAERIIWLAAEAVIALALAYQISAARAWERLYRSVRDSFDSLQDSYDKVSASRDYWKATAQTGAAALTVPPPPGRNCPRCGQPSAAARGGCQHDICGWCAWCPSCAGMSMPGPRSGTIP